MKLSISEEAKVNYLSKVVKIDNIRKHENADRLQITSVDGANIVVGLDVSIGDIMIYCPTESCLNSDFLSKNNLYDNMEMNTDKTIKGYINSRGRVRAIKLRGENSRAFLCKPSNLGTWIFGLDISNIESMVGTEFDTVDGILLSKKYIPLNQKVQKIQDNKKSNKKKDKFVRIIPEQFAFHIDTNQLSKNIHKIDPESYIQISSKLHGSSSISSYILVNRKPKFFEKLFSKFTGTKTFQEYGYVASSRSVIRDEKKKDSFYGKIDLWSYALNELKSHLTRGMTLYYEIVGYLPNTDTYIQKGYDYGCSAGQCEFYIYRITSTNTNGDVFEYSSQQVKTWCKSHGLKSVPELYYGKAKNLFPEIKDIEDWNNEFFKRLQKFFWMEKDDPMCKNKKPFEGVVLRVDNWKDIEVYKLKSERFYQLETKLLDEEIVDIETEN